MAAWLELRAIRGSTQWGNILKQTAIVGLVSAFLLLGHFT
jgi:hypothetical protein